MDGAKVGVFEETNKIRFSGLLESKYCGALEAEIGLVFLSDLTNETLER